jgi:hypothetical protein
MKRLLRLALLTLPLALAPSVGLAAPFQFQPLSVAAAPNFTNPGNRLGGLFQDLGVVEQDEGKLLGALFSGNQAEVAADEAALDAALAKLFGAAASPAL